MQNDDEKLLPPRIVVIQPSDVQPHEMSDSERAKLFRVKFISKLGPGIICLLLCSLSLLVVPAIKGPDDRFCNGYWKNQSNAQMSGTVIIICECTHFTIMNTGNKC
jgi:hypothetical protein